MPATDDDAKLRTWRASKIEEWQDTSSKLHQRFATRTELDGWLDKQCGKAVRNKAVSVGHSVKPGQPLVSLSDVHFTHNNQYCKEPIPVLHGTTLELRQGEVLGIFGLNESGKTTIAKIIEGTLKPNSGTFIMHAYKQEPEAVSILTYATAVLLLSLICVAGADLTARPAPLQWLNSSVVLAAALVAAILAVMCVPRWFRARSQKKAEKASVALITSEDSPGAAFTNQKIKLLEYITELMPNKPTAAARKHYTEVMLKAVGFQMFDRDTGKPVGDVAQYIADGVTLEQCSGGQKHIVYVLRMLAGQPKVLLADEILSSLDQYVKARLLLILQHFLSTKQLDAILFITCDLNSFPFIATRLAYLHKGIIVEQGTVRDVMTKPVNKLTREYVSCHAMVTPSGKDLKALSDNMESLKAEVLATLGKLSAVDLE